MGLLIAPHLSCLVWEFTPKDKRVVSLCLWVGDSAPTVISAYGLNSSSKYPAFLESLGGVLDGTPTGSPLFY